MLWCMVMHLFATLLDWVRIGRFSERDKDLELLLLRQQLDILEQQARQPRLSRAEKLAPKAHKSSNVVESCPYRYQDCVETPAGKVTAS